MQPDLCGCWSLERENEEEGGRVWARAKTWEWMVEWVEDGSSLSRSEVEGARV